MTEGRLNAARVVKDINPPEVIQVRVVDRELEITGTSRGDQVTIDGSSGKLVLQLNGKREEVAGAVDRILFWGGSGNDTFINNADIRVSTWGDAGNDLLIGGPASDQIYGGLGNDELRGRRGDDRLLGAAGDDRLYGGSGNDILHGNRGNDRLFGEEGDDYLNGVGARTSYTAVPATTPSRPRTEPPRAARTKSRSKPASRSKSPYWPTTLTQTAIPWRCEASPRQVPRGQSRKKRPEPAERPDLHAAGRFRGPGSIPVHDQRRQGRNIDRDRHDCGQIASQEVVA